LRTLLFFLVNPCYPHGLDGVIYESLALSQNFPNFLQMTRSQCSLPLVGARLAFLVRPYVSPRDNRKPSNPGPYPQPMGGLPPFLSTLPTFLLWGQPFTFLLTTLVFLSVDSFYRQAIETAQSFIFFSYNPLQVLRTLLCALDLPTEG